MSLVGRAKAETPLSLSPEIAVRARSACKALFALAQKEQRFQLAASPHLGVAQNSRARVAQAVVFGSMYKGAILVHV